MVLPSGSVPVNGRALGGGGPAFGVARVADERVRSTRRGRRRRGAARSRRWPRTTPSSAAPCRAGRSPTPELATRARGGRPDRRRRPSGHARWPLPAGRSSRYHGRPGVELRHHLRLPPQQLGVQQLTEQVVVAVPLAPAVERDHQQVAALQPIEHAAGSLAAHGHVAERTGQPVEDRRAGQERDVGPRHPVEELRAQVVAHEAVVAGGPCSRRSRPGCRRSSPVPPGTARRAIPRSARRGR